MEVFLLLSLVGLVEKGFGVSLCLEPVQVMNADCQQGGHAHEHRKELDVELFSHGLHWIRKAAVVPTALDASTSLTVAQVPLRSDTVKVIWLAASGNPCLAFT
jgi:hypothetical protein